MNRHTPNILRSKRTFHSSFGRSSSYSKSLLLPKTEFSPRIPKGTERDDLLKECGKKLYIRQSDRSKTSSEFTLHDGPPYANGDLHLGHALNKILKDIINRFELINKGKRIHYRPGWDCHGLPIEMKAVKGSTNLSPVEIRKLCRELADSMIEKQREQFRDFAIMANFDEPYVTMTHDYETAQLKIFLRLFENGLLSRQLKPVWWGCETQTALAEAELEYNSEHKSVAVFVKYPLEKTDIFPGYKKVSLLIWTSTPWTLPANKAICVNKDIEYTLIKNTGSGEGIVVAKELAESVLKYDEKYELDSSISVRGSDLEGLKYISPSNESQESFPVLHGDHVSASAGTGLVHTAPAHGMEDYLVGRKHSLKVASSVDEKGHYISENIPQGYQELAGKYANGKPSIFKVIQHLENHDMLFHLNKSYKHSYPYDWRSKTPVVQRATPQWFVNVEKIKDAAASSLDNVEFVPPSGVNRLKAFIQNRSEWCISRQRAWGAPLPIVYHKETNEPIEDPEVIRYTVDRITEYGTDAWFEDESDVSRWLPSNIDGSKYFKGKDTMDVWFDSGTSWSTLSSDLEASCVSDNPLADIYLEGSDQHRGWFQSSLLNKIIASTRDGKNFKPVAPYKKIITHGFLLDKKNKKMSKSLGNVIVPTQVIDGGGKPLVPALGTDGLRLWVASSTYTSDVNVSVEVFQRLLESVKKSRVTFKYLLGNLHDFGPSDRIDLAKLNKLDQWVLSRLYNVQEKVVAHYNTHNFAGVVRELNSHISELSAYYFDISKDCLYTDKKDSHRRRSIQTVLEQILKAYIGLWAPIQPLIAQEAWQLYAQQMNISEQSPFMMPWEFFAIDSDASNSAVEGEINQLWKIRDVLYKELEQLRKDGHYKNKLEVEIFLQPQGAQATSLLHHHAQFLDDYFLVSRATVGPSTEATAGPAREVSVDDFCDGSVNLLIQQSSSSKCPRCWKYIAESEEHLCQKCSEVVG
ncbi:isoleucine-tRNA ligase [Candidozyma duobushaemuli]|uniref:isoleucine--tRNA ligase n=2 Tax=Candidozyma TaxID=3303203 RepID=A0ABX8HZJ3_9ASCO|nr:isoleucine-tRNA ligase [[Candida] duobushaemulonis]PVH17580.1 isoleucine-tRNA ligase [[Candida] duobushaemulonis]QWU86206.1 hypothetical protein CA3LBN_000424 [[Candida] haemuloni]